VGQGSDCLKMQNCFILRHEKKKTVLQGINWAEKDSKKKSRSRTRLSDAARPLWACKGGGWEKFSSRVLIKKENRAVNRAPGRELPKGKISKVMEIPCNAGKQHRNKGSKPPSGNCSSTEGKTITPNGRPRGGNQKRKAQGPIALHSPYQLTSKEREKNSVSSQKRG